MPPASERPEGRARATNGLPPHLFMLELTQRFGDIVRYRARPEPAFLINHPDHVRHVLVRNRSSYSKATASNIRFRAVVADGLLTSEGEEWQRQRELVQPAFDSRRVADMRASIVSAVMETAESWERAAREGKVIDVGEAMSALTLRITLNVVLGAAVGGTEEVLRSVRTALGHFADPEHPAFRNAGCAIDRLVAELIEARGPESAPACDVLSILMDADKSIGKRELRDHVVTLLLAGFETTANALAWAWHLLSRAPEVERRLAREAIDVLGDGRPEAPDVRRLRYVRMAVLETMRLFPPAWILGRRALRDDMIDDRRVPAGAVIAISPFTLHRHPAFWEEPHRFMPERFSPERSESRHALAYIPFGAGPRRCVGHSLATTESVLALAILAARFTLEPCGPVGAESAFVLRPRGLLMRVQHRDRKARL
jgi:enediyne biosynthesis protein E7